MRWTRSGRHCPADETWKPVELCSALRTESGLPTDSFTRILVRDPHVAMTPNTPGLLEREDELEMLRQGVGDARQGRGRLISIEAPGGLGKTRLLAEAARLAAAAGFHCVRARGTELERRFAYGCVRQLFESDLAQLTSSERDGLFTGAAAQARGLFEPGAEDGPGYGYSLLHGLYWLVNNACAQEPLALLLDDVHWADLESLELLLYLAPRLDGIPLLVVAAHRPSEGHGDELAQLAAAPEATSLRPRRLSREATGEICRGRLAADVAPEFVAACHAATGGNPFYLDSLLREVLDRGVAPTELGAGSVERIGPADIARSVRLRLAGRPAAVALVRGLAVLGDRATLAEAAELAALEEAEASAAADHLVRLGILMDDAVLQFGHPIVREAVYADLGPRERAQGHARAATVLRDMGASEERVAAQIVASAPASDPARVALLRRVAADALARGGPAAAVTLLSRASTEPPPPDERGAVLLELALAKLRLGRPEAAIGELELAGRLLDAPALLTKSVRMLAEALTWQEDADGAVAVLSRAIESMDPGETEQRLLLEAERAACAQLGRRDVRESVAAELRRHTDLTGATPGERLILASVAYEEARTSESAAEASAVIERVVETPLLLDEQDLDVGGTIYLLLIALHPTDRLDLVERCVERMLEHAQERASVPAQAFSMVQRGWMALRRGEVADAEADARTTLDLLTAYGIPLGTSYATALLVEALLEGGDIEGAESALQGCPPAHEVPPGPTNPLLGARGLLRMAQGRAEESVDDLVAYGRDEELWGSASPLASRWRSHAALALAATGEAKKARAMAAEQLARARRWGAPVGVGIALRTWALVGAGADMVEPLREAADVLAGSPARLEQARTLTELGAALRRANRRSEAREVLEPALRDAERLGARTVAARARTEILAAGGRAAGPSGAGVEQLTASERRVAELAARGRSNPEIAQALFVTRKTVETHLGRVYRKLSIAGRHELPSRLAGLGGSGR